MASLKTIADNLAARFSGVTATVGSTTESILDGPTASLPNEIGTGPALLVRHPSGVLTVGTSALKQDAYDFPVQLLRDPLSVPERSDWLYAWFDALRDRVQMNVDLDLSYVAEAEPIAVRIELNGEVYANKRLDVVELTVRVALFEHVTTIGV